MHTSATDSVGSMRALMLEPLAETELVGTMAPVPEPEPLEAMVVSRQVASLALASSHHPTN